LTQNDRSVLAEVEAGFPRIGELVEHARFKAGLAEAMHLAIRVNRYLSDEAPWAVLKEDPKRGGTILHVALRCIDNLKVLFTPFLPHSSQQLHEMLGYDGWIAGKLEFREVEEDGSRHVVLTGDYSSWIGRWEPTSLPVGQALREPGPLFRKLDAGAVVEEELRRMEAAASAS
jgi:methionyl-tRNA synthetase